MNMSVQNGSILISSVLMDDSNFKKSVIFIAEHNEKGTIGFVINKPFGRKLNELIEFKDSAPFELFEGGPVEMQQLFMIHRRPDIIEESTLITSSISMGGKF